MFNFFLSSGDVEFIQSVSKILFQNLRMDSLIQNKKENPYVCKCRPISWLALLYDLNTWDIYL